MGAGRPRSFDREAALTKAMHVFWEKGYEGTTMTDIIERIGVKAPSVYAAFGNKDKLFTEVVDAYSQLIQSGPIKILMETSDVFEAIKGSLNSTVQVFSGVNNPCSCLVLTAAINCAPEHAEHFQKLQTLRAEYKSAFAKRFLRAKEEGQLVENADYLEMAEFMMTFIHGLALRARDGSTREQLGNSSKITLEIMKAFILK